MADTSFFSTFNSLVDGGWLAKLTGSELAYLVVHLRYMDREGVAFPSAGHIAGLLGQKTPNNVHRTRSRLRRLGLLSDVADRRLGMHSKRLRLTVPLLSKTPAKIIDCPKEAQPPAGMDVTPLPKSNDKPCQKMADILSQYSLNEQHNNQGLMLLLNCGVEKQKAADLARAHNAAKIAAVMTDVERRNDKVRNRAGLAIALLERGFSGPPPASLTPKSVCALINEGKLRSIGGRELAGMVAKWNSQGIFLLRPGEETATARIPVSALTAESMEYHGGRQ